MMMILKQIMRRKNNIILLYNNKLIFSYLFTKIINLILIKQGEVYKYLLFFSIFNYLIIPFYNDTGDLNGRRNENKKIIMDTHYLIFYDIKQSMIKNIGTETDVF